MTDERTGAQWFSDKVAQDTETLRRRVDEMKEKAETPIGDDTAGIGEDVPFPPGTLKKRRGWDLTVAREAREAE